MPAKKKIAIAAGAAMALTASGCDNGAPPATANAGAGAEAGAGLKSDELVGTWDGGLGGGGPIAASRKDVFAKDGTYKMDGYPSIGERAKYAVISRAGNRLEVRFTNRLRCGPCSAGGPDTATPDDTRTLELSGDGASLRDGQWTLTKAK